ncbi:hypothetical protein FDJ25_gp003 [Vibrio phage Aphrodite1]|uniref:Uncharacterized protein n=1 Tax=Vibrio phage Aphrodite1 TaxID=2070057 RepID=A0A2I7QHY4_9CAUD|nr:hypothetical protein FDJ25_gp003 [Vibrio phage Aphrodite1]AUR81010.1 hypothetical protein Aphrodite1_0207 [Vibrio phage Aphrodite1]
MAFKILTDLDSMLDTRQGTLDVLLEPVKETFDNVYGDLYFKRVLDKFDREPFGITMDRYRDAFKNRDIATIVKSRPTPLLKRLFSVVVDAEALTGKPIRVESIEITVLTAPYDLPDEVLNDLKKILEGNLGYRCSVNFDNRPAANVTGSYVSNFTHVFIYHLLGEAYSEFTKTFDQRPSPDTKLFIPAVFLKEPDELGISPTTQIQRVGLLWSVLWTVVPLPLKFYDGLSAEESRRLEATLSNE